MEWEELTLEEQLDYYTRAQFLIDKGYKPSETDTEELAKEMYEKSNVCILED